MKKIAMFGFAMTGLLLSATGLAEPAPGKIVYVSFASSVSTTVRPGTLQFSIEGGFSEFGDCDRT